MDRILDNLERDARHADNRANARQTAETRIMDDLLAVIAKHVTAEAYMQAENTCTMNDIRERDRWGEDSDSVGDLRNVRRDVMVDARALAESLARLVRDVAATSER